MRRGIYDGTYHTHPNPKTGRDEPVAILVRGWECSASDCPFKKHSAVVNRTRLGPTTASMAGKSAPRRKS
jgi:hypothetical protein